MTLQDVADALVAGVRDKRTTENIDLLYSDDIVSVEAANMGGPREAHGRDGLKAKHAWWDGAMDVLEQDVRGPFLHLPDRFACFFTMTTRDKTTGEVSDHEEVGIYTVADGKIVREEFYYAVGPQGEH